MTFGELLAEYIERAGLTRIEFGRRIGRGSGWVTQCIQGIHAPRVDEPAAWAEVLGLDEAEAEAFVSQGQLVKLKKKADLAPIVERIERAEERVGAAEVAAYQAQESLDGLVALLAESVDDPETLKLLAEYARKAVQMREHRDGGVTADQVARAMIAQAAKDAATQAEISRRAAESGRNEAYQP